MTMVKMVAVISDHERETATASAWQQIDNATTLADVEAASAAWAAVVQGISAGLLKSHGFTVSTFDSDGIPLISTYGDAEDKAFLQFADTTSGRAVTYQVAVPRSADFAATDQETVNPADGGVAAFIAYVEGNNSTDSGFGPLAYTLGYRRRGKSRSERPGIPSAIG